jgi:hypothetical protein
MFQVPLTCRYQVRGGSQRVPALCDGVEPCREVLQQVVPWAGELFLQTDAEDLHGDGPQGGLRIVRWKRGARLGGLDVRGDIHISGEPSGSERDLLHKNHGRQNQL